MFNATKKYTYAIIGASQDYNKYGYKVLFDLLDNGYVAFPVNPKGGFIDDVQVFSSLKEVPKKIDIAVFVVPPLLTEKILKEVHKLGIDKAWLQPGSASQDAIDFCKQHNIDCMHDVCVMIQKN